MQDLTLLELNQTLMAGQLQNETAHVYIDSYGALMAQILYQT